MIAKIRKKNKLLIKILIAVLMLSFTPIILAAYVSNITSMATFKFQTNHDMTKTYVRAHIITYWIDPSICENSDDLSTCAIVGKIGWKLNTNNINSNWTKVNNYYYYASEYEMQSIEELPEEILLIDSELGISQLSEETLNEDIYLPQYQVVYEFLEAGITENNKQTSEEYWCVGFKNGKPQAVENC